MYSGSKHAYCTAKVSNGQQVLYLVCLLSTEEDKGLWKYGGMKSFKSVSVET